MSDEEVIISIKSLDETRLLAKRLCGYFFGGGFVSLYGPLGSGKTEFVRSAMKSLGFHGDVPSPTFTLVQSYELDSFSVSHFDLYRLKNKNELYELGWEDAIYSGLVFVEWPERAGDLIPVDRLEIHFLLEGDSGRSARIIPVGKWKEKLVGFRDGCQ